MIFQNRPQPDNIHKPLEGIKILDVGCGAGVLSEVIILHRII